MKDVITNELYIRYDIMLSDMKNKAEINIIRDINIKSIKIIGCESYKSASKDRYIAYTEGTILDYTINELTGIVIKNPNKTLETFSDTYHFVRSNNVWLLENINNKVGTKDILNAKIYKE